MESTRPWKYCYWMDNNTLEKLKKTFTAQKLPLVRAEKNPCETLKAETGFAEPESWEIICKHDAAVWYDCSPFKGKNLVVSSAPLDSTYTPFLETTITPVDFSPSHPPSAAQMAELSKDPDFIKIKPEKWDHFPKDMGEQIVMGLSKIMANPMEPWDRLFTTWTAVHANFISPRFRAGEKYQNAPYSISDTYRISSCCVELFNLLDSKEKALLVRPCTGALMINALEKDRYYYVRMVKNS